MVLSSISKFTLKPDKELRTSLEKKLLKLLVKTLII